jgi:hypothetical protein
MRISSEKASAVGRRVAIGWIALLAVSGIGSAGASAAVRTVHLRYGPISLQPAELKSAVRRAKSPHMSGFVTKMHAYVVDVRGRRLASNRVMLHHAVFRRLIPPRPDRYCAVTRDSEPFYATGEEDESLGLPHGYGMRIRRHDGWLLRWMVMNHTNRPWKVFIRYDVRIDTSPRIVPVQPLWLRVLACHDGSFDVPGNGGPGSIFTKSRQIVVGRTGRIVAATGHLHGGAVGLTLSEPRCGGRALVTARPVYRSGVPRPQDGPVHVTSFRSPVGIPIFRGELLDLTATYDNSMEHDDVMGTMHVYVARGLPRPSNCLPLPSARTG